MLLLVVYKIKVYKLNCYFYINIVAKIIKLPEEAIYVPGEILTQKCSARGLYPMTVTWQESRSLFSIKVKMDSHETKGLYNILNSTVIVNISLLTPLSFRMRCIFTTYIYIQPDNFTKAHGLYQKGLLFEKPKGRKANVRIRYRTMTIHR